GEVGFRVSAEEQHLQGPSADPKWHRAPFPSDLRRVRLAPGYWQPNLWDFSPRPSYADVLCDLGGLVRRSLLHGHFNDGVVHPAGPLGGSDSSGWAHPPLRFSSALCAAAHLAFGRAGARGDTRSAA